VVDAARAAIHKHRAQFPVRFHSVLQRKYVFGDPPISNVLNSHAENELFRLSLVIALKVAPPALRQKFMANMSRRAADLLSEEMEARGSVRLSEVEAQQRKILRRRYKAIHFHAFCTRSREDCEETFMPTNISNIASVYTWSKRTSLMIKRSRVLVCAWSSTPFRRR